MCLPIKQHGWDEPMNVKNTRMRRLQELPSFWPHPPLEQNSMMSAVLIFRGLLGTLLAPCDGTYQLLLTI
jgi:hypothetical protein